MNLPEQTFIDPLGQALVDVVVTNSGVKVRPGFSLLIDTGTGEKVTGIFDWKEQSCVIIVSGGKVFKMSQFADSFFLLEDGNKLLLEDGTGYLTLERTVHIEDVTGDTLSDLNRVIFASYRDYLYMAFGGRIVELHPSASTITHNSTNYTCIKNNIDIEPGVTSGWETYWEVSGSGGDDWNQYIRYGSGLAEFLEDADAPTQVKWIGVADKYLLALKDDTQEMWFSEVGKPWAWDNDWVSVEFLPDDAIALRVQNGDVWIAGRDSIQSFNNDGVTPWVTSSYGAIRSGIMAPYSFVDDGNGQFYYIDNDRRFVKLEGRTAHTVDTSINTFLNTVKHLTDAIADYVIIGGDRFYIVQFPRDHRTLAINLDTKSWSEWHHTSGSDKLQWMANCIEFVQDGDFILTGSTTDGTINILSQKYEQDKDVDIKATIRTPRLQTEEPIFVKDLCVGLSKVATTTDYTIESSISVRWRDDGKDWSDYLTKTVEGTETDHVIHFRRIGSYRNNRQYEFDCTNLYPYAIRKVDQT